MGRVFSSRWLSRRWSAAALVAALALSACGAAKKAAREGDRWMAQERPEAAARAYQRAVSVDPDHPTYQAKLALAHLEAGAPEKALAPARLARAEGEPGADLVLARALIRTQSWDEAIPLLRDALGGGDETQVYAALADAYLSAGRLADAADAGRRAAESGAPASLAASAYLHARAGVSSAGSNPADDAARAQTMAPDDAAVQAEVAAAHLLLGDLSSAKAAAEAANNTGFHLRKGWQEEAQALYEAGDREAAIRLGLRVFAMEPQDPRLPWVIGVWWLEAGEPERAADMLSQALAHPDYDVGEDEGVAVASTQGLTRDQRLAARRDIGLALADAFEQLRDAEGQARALQVAATAGHSAEAYVKLSTILDALGRHREALDAAHRALEIAPDLPEANARVARAYAAAGDVDRALRYASTAWKKRPEDVEYALLASELYEKRGELRLALEVVNTTLRMITGDPRLATVQARLKVKLEAY